MKKVVIQCNFVNDWPKHVKSVVILSFKSLKPLGLPKVPMPGTKRVCANPIFSN